MLPESLQISTIYVTNSTPLKVNIFSLYIPTKLADHTLTAIPTPNNDSLYVFSLLDMRDDAIVIKYPAFDSMIQPNRLIDE